MVCPLPPPSSDPRDEASVLHLGRGSAEVSVIHSTSSLEPQPSSWRPLAIGFLPWLWQKSRGRAFGRGPCPFALEHLDPGGESSVGTTSPGWGLEKPSRCPGQRGLLRERKPRGGGEGASSGASVNRPSSRVRRAQPGALARGRGKWSEAHSHALVSQTLGFGHPRWMIARQNTDTRFNWNVR